MTEWNEIVEVLRRQGMPAEGIQMVKLAFDQAPVRKELGHGGNVRTDYHSRKTGRTFRTESHTNELPLAEELERDPSVLWYVLQPFKLELMVGSGVGSTRVHVTPDALVVRESRVDVEEWKLPKDYVRLPEKHPRRYRFDGEEVTSPPMVAKLSAWGMGFRVRHPGHLTGEFLENCHLLEDFLGPDAPDLSTVAQTAIKVAFEQQGMWSMEALREAQPVLTADDVYIAIAKRLVFFDLTRDRLATPHLAFLYSSELRAQLARRERELQAQALSPPYFDIQVGMVFALDGNEYTVEVVGTQEVVVSDGSGAQRRLQQSLLRDAYPSALKIVSLPPEECAGSLLAYLLEFTSDADLKEASRKLSIVRGELPVGDTPRRTLTSWRRKVADAEALGHDGLVGLIPNRMTQGNRSARIDKDNMDLIENTLRDRYYSEERPTKRSAYGFYEVACSKVGVVPVSEQTFGAYADLLQTPTRDHKRHGNRLAKARRPAHVHEAFAPSVHGVFALDVLSIDHTQADVELRSEIDGEPLGRPWLSVATSTYSRKILADHLSYMAPNSSVVLALLREVARKTGRLPRVLVVDNGPDFRSAELERFCKAYRIKPRWRPKGDPRFGSVMERTFGKLNSEFFHRLRGSTKVMTAVRTMTGSHLPEKITAWTLRHLKIALGVYIEVDYNEGDHPTLAPASKDRVHRDSVEKHGSRAHKRVFVDRRFNILCCPLVDRRTRKIHVRTGVKVKETYYHAEELRSPALHGVTTDVRFDPSNLDIVYVLDKKQNHWIEARRVNRLEARGLNDWELQLLTAELVRRKVLTVEQAKNPDRVAREARVCSVIEGLENEAKLLFRKLREEGKISALGSSASPVGTGKETSASPAAAEDDTQKAGDRALSGSTVPVYDDYSGGLQ